MRTFLGGLCMLLIGLQVLIGVPLAVCFAFFNSLPAGGVHPVTFQVHAGSRYEPTVPPADFPPPTAHATFIPAPPPNKIPTSADDPENPILQTREETGSPLAGTVLASPSHEDEQQLFLTALEKAAAEAPEHCPAASTPDICSATCPLEAAPIKALDTAQQLVMHLYAMAQLDEDAGHFDRADQWRSLARELRKHDTPAKP